MDDSIVLSKSHSLSLGCLCSYAWSLQRGTVKSHCFEILREMKYNSKWQEFETADSK